MSRIPDDQPTLFDSAQLSRKDAPIEETYAPLQDRKLPSRSARRKLCDALESAVQMNKAAAEAISRAVVNPEDVRRKIQAPTRHRLQGGTLYTVDADVWTCAVLPFPANPRTADTWRFAAAGGCDTAAPVPAIVRDAFTDRPQPVLEVKVASLENLKALVSANSSAILTSNNLVDSIAHQGILSHGFAVVAKVSLDDGTYAYALTSTDGSSRITAAQRILKLETTKVLFPFAEPCDTSTPTPFERYVNGVLRERDEIDGRTPRREVVSTLESRQRVLVAPMTIVVKWEANHDSNVDLTALVRARIGIIHVGGARAWDQSSQHDATADSVIDTLLRDSLVDNDQHRWLAGLMPPVEAAEKNHASLADERFIAVLDLILDERKKRTVNKGIRQMLPTGNPKASDRIAIGVELSLRAVRTTLDPSMLSRARVTFSDVLSEAVLTTPKANPGEGTKYRRLANIVGNGETLDELLEIALSDATNEAAVANRRLSLLALWHMTLANILVRVDGRSVRSVVRPGAVLLNMRSCEHGLRILHRIVADARAGVTPRLVEENGSLSKDDAGKDILLTSDGLRDMFDQSSTSTESSNRLEEIVVPADRLRHLTDEALRNLASAFGALNEAMIIESASGDPLYEIMGLEEQVLSDSREYVQQLQVQLATVTAATQKLFKKRREAASAELAVREAGDERLTVDAGMEVA